MYLVLDKQITSQVKRSVNSYYNGLQYFVQSNVFQSVD